jgi:hypothetical protein
MVVWLLAIVLLSLALVALFVLVVGGPPGLFLKGRVSATQAPFR